ncbi:hypothetical protein DRW03_25305 [Corallococcus sp. H22C18031201]|nr:hypothetical protein [Citreicoccus inhibens]RJS18441.1 hypothetical protein DRW03_25305 [Corallococcus sp. H22C18031201]
MKWYERHVDAGLTRWSLGELAPHEGARMMRHAHACPRCGPRYERWMRAHRVLETGTPEAPSPREQELLTSAGLQAALAAAAPEESRTRWPSLTVLGAALAATLLVVTLTPRLATHEWRSRGQQSHPTTEVALRIFCAVSGHPLRELRAGEACPRGSTLAFAAGARQPLSHVAVRVSVGGVTEEVSGPFSLDGTPGGEHPLEMTVPLTENAQRVEVTAAFSAQPATTVAALHGEKADGVVVLKQEVRVEESP